MNCVHCKRSLRSCRPRGLCPRCYRILDIRNLYPSKNKGYLPSSAAAKMTGPGKPAKTSTRALPGSLEKILIMQERVANQERTDHPKDATWGEEYDDV